MGSAKKGTVQLGLWTFPVRLEVAVDDESSGTHTICTNEGTHEPTRVKAHVDCPTCGKSETSVWGYDERGLERDGKVVAVTAEEIKAAKGTPIKVLALTFHNREKVAAATVSAGSVQNVYPDKGGERGYTALVDEFRRRPDQVACAVWAPSTKNALWMLELVGERIVATKLPWPEDVRAAASPPQAEVTDVEQSMVSTLVDAFTEDFDVSKYQNLAKQGVEALIAARMGQASPAQTGGTSAPPVADMLEALQASVAALKKPKKVTTRKPVAKKAAKKVATRRRTAA